MSRAVLIIFIIGVYFAALLLISHFTSRRVDNSTFFIGGRKMPWLAVALAMVTAPISGVTYISVPGMVLTKGYGYLQMCLGFIVGYFIIAMVLVPLYYKKNIVSIYSFLEDRFGTETYKTGAWFFLISKMLGTAVKFLVVCLVLQVLVFDFFHIPFFVNVILTISLIAAYTFRGGVKTVIWTDMFKSIVLVTSIGICIFIIVKNLDFSIPELFNNILSHPSTKILFLDDPSESSYFWKQFIAGIFLVIAMTGLDQDMMQHTLSCRDSQKAGKNLYLSSFLQFGVITLFLILGSLLIFYMESHSVTSPQKTDDLFALIAFHEEMPLIVGILFILGLVSASYSSVGSALTSLTTSFTVDIMDARKKYDEDRVVNKRKKFHIGIAIVMALIIISFYYLNNEDAISAVFTLASYTYGPILGLFIFGIFTKKRIDPRNAAIICIMAPILSWGFQWFAKNFLDYTIGFELLLLNAGIILFGLSLLPSLKYELSDSNKIY